MGAIAPLRFERLATRALRLTRNDPASADTAEVMKMRAHVRTSPRHPVSIVVCWLPDEYWSAGLAAMCEQYAVDKFSAGMEQELSA